MTVGRGDARAARPTPTRRLLRQPLKAPPPDVVALIPVRPLVVREPTLTFRLGAADRPLVLAGARVNIGDPLIARVREASVAEARLGAHVARSAPAAVPPEEPVPSDGTEAPVMAPSPSARPQPRPRPGDAVERGLPVGADPKGRPIRFEGTGRVLYEAPGSVLRVAVGEYRELVVSPLTGLVEVVDAGRVSIRADGFGIPAALAAGDAGSGALTLAVAGPDAELRASAVDVAAAGAVLVAGARVDIETLTRARAAGVRGIIAGGIADRDLRAFVASEDRQRAVLHTMPPFALVVLDGGRRAIASAVWEILAAAAGTEVALVSDPPMLVLDAARAIPPVPPDLVRVTAGPAAGAEGRVVGAAGKVRGGAGVYQESARVAVLDGAAPREIVVPVADLERFG